MHDDSNVNSKANLNLSGLSNLECLVLNWFKFDLRQTRDPFANLNKLRQLKLNYCKFLGDDLAKLDFSHICPNIEKIELQSNNLSPLSLDTLSGLKNLKFLNLQFENYDYRMCARISACFLKDLTALVEFNCNLDLEIGDDTFAKLNKLKKMQIKAKIGDWMRHLANLNTFDFCLDSYNVDLDYIYKMTQLAKLKLYHNGYQNDSIVLKSGAFKGIKQSKYLKSLSLHFRVKQMEANVFDGLENITEFELHLAERFSLKSEFFKCFNNLKMLSIGFPSDIETDFLENFPNLSFLQLRSFKRLHLTERTFSKQRNLKKLEIISCNIFPAQILPDNIFVDLKNLSELHLDSLDSNILANANTFNGLKNLIEFSCIRIEGEFNEDILRRMPKLQRLVLDRQMRNSVDIIGMKTQFPDIHYIRFDR